MRTNNEKLTDVDSLKKSLAELLALCNCDGAQSTPIAYTESISQQLFAGLSLDHLYVKLLVEGKTAPLEVLLSRSTPDPAFRQLLLGETEQWRKGTREKTVRSLEWNGQRFSISFVPIGCGGQGGGLASVCVRPNFPSPLDDMTLRMASKDATVAIECWRLKEVLEETEKLREKVLGTLHQQKKAEDHISFQSSLLDQVCNAVIATNLKGEIIYCNKFAESLYQFRREEVIGRLLKPLIVPSSHAAMISEMAQSIDECGSWQGELALQRRDGSAFDGYFMETPIANPGEGRCGSVTVSFDISLRKDAEEALKNSRQQLRTLMGHLQWVREKERAHIAREIHDELGQSLTGVKIDLAWLENRVTRHLAPELTPTWLQKIASMGELIDTTIWRIRKISTELRPRILDELGLVAALEWQSREFQTKTGITCRFSTSLEQIALDDERATAVFRIFQETLTNILRHSQAGRVEIDFWKEAETVALRVKDNGKGISKNKIYDPTSLGLLGMRERVLLTGGELDVDGQAGKGTVVTLRMPINRTASPEIKPPAFASKGGSQS